jgi:hypothetical protein
VDAVVDGVFGSDPEWCAEEPPHAPARTVNAVAVAATARER